jgi:hypothetical protein
MKNFKENEIEDLNAVVGGIGGPANDWKITAGAVKDEWNCWHVEVDVEVKKVNG